MASLLQKECYGLIKKIRADKKEEIQDDLYYIIPKLKGAAEALAYKPDAAFCEALGQYLKLTDKAADEYGLCAFLRKHGVSDRDVRRLSCYLTLIYCRKIAGGDVNGISLLRRADRLNYKNIISECSPLEKKLILYENYALSDEETRRLYRARLHRFARRKRCGALAALSYIPSHKLTKELFKPDGRAATLHIILLICIFILFCTGLFLLCGDIFAVLFAFLPFYRLSEFVASKLLFRLIPPYVPARVNEDFELPGCLIVKTSVLDGGFEHLCQSLEHMFFTEGERKNTYFGILADLPDSRTKYDKDDKALISAAEKQINALNLKHGNRFFLFLRQRKYSLSEGMFIAPDRKRGAVCELVRQLQTKESSLEIYGADAALLSNIPYVITLDSDTLLYPGSSADLLRCACHPANTPVIDKKRRVVTSGHGIYQPRVKPKLKSEADTPFCSVYSADSGIDVYFGADFDVLSAAYGKGSFCGKGLIDVSAFYECCVDVFPAERILSHDAIEGCRLNCAAVTDTVMYENTPKNALSYFRRLDRWVRGDVLSLPFTYSKVKGADYKKHKNGLGIFERLLLKNSVIHALTPVFALLCIVYGLISGQLPLMSLCGLSYIVIPSLFCIFYNRYDRYGLCKCIEQLLMQVSFLFYEAQTSLFAAIKALIRLITHKHMLQWTTASAADKAKNSSFSYIKAFLPSFVFGFILAVTSLGASVITGTLFMLSPVIAAKTAKEPDKKPAAKADTAFLKQAVKDHMKYFDDLVISAYNYLPPDNYQVFYDVGAAPRTSPTNVGLYLLSVIATADLGIYGINSIYEKLQPTLATLLRIPKKDGLLYNWYDTRTLKIINNFVSTVDCGNYLCALITLKSALYEYAEKDKRLYGLIEITDRLITECDLKRLYDKDTGLFYIGEGNGADNKYDLYESEMHTTDIAAIAYGYAPASHLCALSRPVIGRGEYRGIASWGGTAFEYFMPALFLPSPEGSINRRALRYAAYMQRKNDVSFDGARVHGVSESCYYSFDSDMNYQYKAHGVNGLSLCADSRELVISPYSLFLMLGYDKDAVKTLKVLKARGCHGKYGFYEAVDLTRQRVGGGAAVIKCFMAHHIGMSIVAAANRCTDGVFIKRFCRDARICSVLALLYEKFPSSKGVKFKNRPSKALPPLPVSEREADCALLTNTVCTAVSDPYGTGLYYKNVCICTARHEGLRGLSLLCRSGGVFDLIKHPVSFSDCFVKYGHENCYAKLSVCGSCAAFKLEVQSDGGSALCFEPVLTAYDKYRRHTAYSSLFITAEEEKGVIRFIKRGKDGFCISVAACTDRILPLFVYTKADEMYGFKTLNALFKSTPHTTFGACIYPRLYAKTDLPEVCYYIGAGRDKAASDRALFSAINEKISPQLQLPLTDSAILHRVLRCVMRPMPKAAGTHVNVPYKNVLYKHGISGDKPIILLDGTGDDGISQLRTVFPGYAQTAVRLLIAGIEADTVIIYDKDDGYYNKKQAELYRMAGACGVSALLGTRIFIAEVNEEEKEVFSSVCVYKITYADKNGSTPYIPQEKEYEKSNTRQDKPPYFEGDCAVIPSSLTYSQMSFIYANPSFGTLVTDRSGGSCWYLNSRMFALTAHDTVPGGPSEELLFYHNGKTYELFSYSRQCRFYPSYAEWSGKIDDTPYTVTVCVDDRMPFKVITLDTDCKGETAYRVEPVLGEHRVNGSLRFVFNSDTSYITNALEAYRPSLFINCKNSVSDFDGKTVTVKCLHEKSTFFTVGAATSHTAVEYMVKNSGGAERRYAQRIKRYLSPFSLHSTDARLDTFFNLYSRYQALICRQFARCGFSQTGGAYGFRDQLQDCLCTVYGEPALAKAHILRCAAHQYEEGDVMHWFHPLTETGIRSRCSDDMLWLPYAVYKYIKITGDKKILDINVRYISSEPLSDNERDRYEKAVLSDKKDPLLMHCIKAASRIKTGEHGLCLTGGGDWNDGMNEAGIKGKGESVWLTLFAADVLKKLAYLCELCGVSGEKYRVFSSDLLCAAEEHGYYKDHYIRGYLDDGTPFGKSGDTACEIDILPQAFAALQGLDKDRVSSSLELLYQKLFDSKNGIIKLFSPPFDGQDGIGYITSYPPGVRENGGQYTHGALWGISAFFKAGMAHKGYEMLKAINPANHTSDKNSFIKYGREPYAFCGDVYTANGLYGRGGWSWYTGAAGWYFTVTLEYLLGYDEHDGGFSICPSFCSEFSRFSLTINRHNTRYTVTAENSEKQTMLDGIPTDKTFFAFDGGDHTLEIGRSD